MRFFLFFIIVSTQFFILNSYSVEMGSFGSNNTDFKSLFNYYRVGVPDNLPWAGSWWAYKHNGISSDGEGARDKSPAEKYDEFHGLGMQTFEWEKENHTCDKLTNEDSKKSCRGWWGHCNAWAAAAILHEQPEKSFKKGNFEFVVADQKALLTELYMENYSLFVGGTDKSKKIGEWIFDTKDPGYHDFWDVTPAAFFLIMTNYLGIQKTGVVIDRFTGDQVWNQPIAGYRILPIRGRDIAKEPIQVGNNYVYPVRIRMNLYWADDGVGQNIVSGSFDASKDGTDVFMKDDFEARKHYHGRSLSFYLYFSEELKMDGDLKVLSVGSIVGDGQWWHQTKEGHDFYGTEPSRYNKMHPDFIWFPTKVNDFSGRNYRNPNIDSSKVFKILSEEGRIPDIYTCTYEAINNGTKRLDFSFVGKSEKSKDDACGKARRVCLSKKKWYRKCRLKNK